MQGSTKALAEVMKGCCIGGIALVVPNHIWQEEVGCVAELWCGETPACLLWHARQLCSCCWRAGGSVTQSCHVGAAERRCFIIVGAGGG